MSQKKPPAKKIKPPKGTRDLYPEDVLRQQYITNAWRDASIRCGFEEIAGPTFETTELYAVKSGEGILGELFQAFSGKGGQETLDKLVEKGQAEFALRPEFTPTLARMYAAKAKELPQPCKWFTAGPYFRAERPQRGRLREFLQWNVDAIGLPSDGENARAMMDVEIIECAIRLMEDLGLQSDALAIKLNDRNAMTNYFTTLGVDEDQLEAAFTLLDRQAKLPADALRTMADEASLPEQFITFLTGSSESLPDLDASDLDSVTNACTNVGIDQWTQRDHSIARGLAYYTGTVFEALADGERAVAGGGRYDNLIELFGGPPTPACGFGMGDVVLGNLLDDKGLMPSGAELMDAVSHPQASIRPVAFVVPNGDEGNEPLVHTLVSNLRRGIESTEWQANNERKPWDRDRYAVEPMHARITYKTTRNMKKLRADAVNQHARFFVEIHADNKVELTNLDTREPITSDTHGSFSIDPNHENYVGSAIATRM
jgi:histidyl-tRNA synthetase